MSNSESLEQQGRLQTPYQFPTNGLKRQLDDPSKTPLVLIGCGSYSPITFLHLRLFEIAADYVRSSNEFELVGAYISPVSDAYKKKGLAQAEDRIQMCELVLAQEAEPWLMLDPWEAIKPEYTATPAVLDHFHDGLNPSDPSTPKLPSNATKPAVVVLLAGADLIKTMSIPTVWTHAELSHILGTQYLTFVIERAGTDIDDALAFLKEWKKNIYVLPQMVQNTVSSSLVRWSVARGLSVRFLVPRAVVDYVREKELYKDGASVPSAEFERQLVEMQMPSRI